MDSVPDEDIQFKEIQQKIKFLEEKRKSRLIFSVGDYSISTFMALKLHSLIRKIKDPKTIELVIDSGGGSIDASAKIVNIFKEYCETFNVIVPFFAKSAATFIALSADNLFLCKAGELGPVDPQVRHPGLGIFFPASSIKDALDFIERTKDPFIKLTMADKLDPFLIGAYESAIRESAQYLSEIPHIKGARNCEDIVFSFTKKYIDHGYPINKGICSALNLPNCKSNGVLDKDAETLLYDIYEHLIELLISRKLDLIVVSSDDKTIIEGKEDLAGSTENPRKSNLS